MSRRQNRHARAFHRLPYTWQFILTALASLASFCLCYAASTIVSSWVYSIL